MAPTWEEPETQLREDAWNPTDKEEFQEEMARRAMACSGTEIDTELISRQFFEELERGGLLLIVRW